MDRNLRLTGSRARSSRQQIGWMVASLGLVCIQPACFLARESGVWRETKDLRLALLFDMRNFD